MEMNDDDHDEDHRLLLVQSSVEVGGTSTATSHQRKHCRQVGHRLRKEKGATKRGRTMPTRRMSKEEEDDNNNEEDDCAPATPTAAAITGRHPRPPLLLCHYYSATTASALAVAAVTVSQCSGLQYGTVAASRMPSLTPAFLCCFSLQAECLLHVA